MLEMDVGCWTICSPLNVSDNVQLIINPPTSNNQPIPIRKPQTSPKTAHEHIVY